MSLRITCCECNKIWKGTRHMDQCKNCLKFYCNPCADKEQTVVNTHLKNALTFAPDLQKLITIAGRPWKKDILLCVDCYNLQLDAVKSTYETQNN